jgi:hypothetical protein
MKGFISALVVSLVLLFATPLCKAQTKYTNTQQNFAIYVPGTVDESSSNQASYAMVSFTGDDTLGVMVYSPNIQVPNTRETVSSIDLSDLGAYGCQDTTYHDDFARICSINTTNNAGVKIGGKVWVDVHNDYVYTVAVLVSIGTPSENSVDYYLNSFVFLK